MNIFNILRYDLVPTGTFSFSATGGLISMKTSNLYYNSKSQKRKFDSMSNDEQNIVFEDISGPIQKSNTENTEDHEKENFSQNDENEFQNKWDAFVLHEKNAKLQKDEHEKEYHSLYEELQDKCNPSNFLPPNIYDKQKADIANDICMQVRDAKHNIELQKELRRRAITELGIHFNSNALCDKLKEYTNPNKYIKTEKFNIANELYSRILENRKDVETLEKIQSVIESELLNETIDEIENREKEEREKREKREDTAIGMSVVLTIITIMIIVAIAMAVGSNK